MTLILEGNRSESIFFVIPVIGGLEIPDEEIAFTASRSGGPGGQNVNKVSTRVTLLFDVDHSAVLDPDQRERIRTKLAARINKDGILKVTSQRTRSQDMNRSDALDRFVSLLRDALRIEQPRIPTRVPRAVRARRLDEKKKRTKLKLARSKKASDES